MSRQPRVVVVGGGLAGMRAALDCADAGASVALIERRPRLGGLTRSFRHQGRWIDNGQHVFLRCCTAYLGFLDRIGSAADVHIQDRLDITVLRPGDAAGATATGATATGATGTGANGTGSTVSRAPLAGRLHRNGLPAPLHLGWSLLHYAQLPVLDRLRVGRAALPLRSLDLDDPALDTETFGGWLRRHGQSDRSIEALWDLITVATVNLPADQASLTMGAKVFQTGLLTDAGAADIGWSLVPLGRLHGQRAATALAQAGTEVSCGETVTGISAGRASPLAVRTKNRTLEADAVVVAVPHLAAAAILPPDVSSRQSQWPALGTSAIINVHVVFDRPVTTVPLAAGVGTAMQWVFDRTDSSGLHDGDTAAGRTQYLAVSLSAADCDLGSRPDELSARVVSELARVFPRAAEARVIDTLVTKERHATFGAVPGTGALRPRAHTRIPGLALAGAWTDTGWPATMEGAVRSGRAAARCALLGAGSCLRTLPEEAA